jgi:DNA-binding NarL/FixJ family response regulator
MKHLLLVEDNPVFLDQLSVAIDQLPAEWQVLSCINGETALDTLKQTTHGFDLAMIDLGLPDIGGLEIIRACRLKLPEMPIVVVSVIAAESTVISAIEAGANGYLLKGDSIAEITKGINQVMNGIYPLSPSLARLLFKRLCNSTPQELNSEDFKLTPREKETLKHMSIGHSYDQVAELMGVATSTVQSNVRNIYRKLNVHSQMQAVSKARNFNLIS